MPSPNRLYVGIDIHKCSAEMALLTPSGQVLEMHHAFPNSYPGMLRAKQLLLEQLVGQGLSGVNIALEATGYYWLPLYIQLAQDAELAAFDPQLALLNAGWLKWFKKSFPPDHKSDQRDPYYIAERLRTLPHPTWWAYDPHWLALRMRTRLRFHFTQTLVREKNHYQMFLFLAHSGYACHKPLSDPFGRLSQRLLAQPELLAGLAELPEAELSEQLYQLSQHHLPDPDGVAAKLLRGLHESYPIPDDLSPVLQDALRSLAASLQALQVQIDLIDQDIARQLQQGYPQVTWLESVPGIGPIFASGIAAEIGDLQRFSTHPKWDQRQHHYRARTRQEIEDAVAKFSGLWWPTNASGQSQAEERPLSKRGNAYLRFFVLQAADRMRLRIPSYIHFYQTKFQQATKHHHKRALVLTGRRALGLFVGLLHRQEPYRPEEDKRSPYA